jgi:hypothetical protein
VKMVVVLFNIFLLKIRSYWTIFINIVLDYLQWFSHEKSIGTEGAGEKNQPAAKGLVICMSQYW